MVGGSQNDREKLPKTSMESANRIHVQWQAAERLNKRTSTVLSIIPTNLFHMSSENPDEAKMHFLLVTAV